jgi:hypothetical protein
MTNETKQTAVEWLFEQLPNKLKPHLKKELQQAKEIEKEQIKSAFNIGEYMAHDYFYGNHECAENYYNETYGGNK